MAEHELKTHPEAYDAMARGEKPWEVRVNDRDYQVGDILFLRRWEPVEDWYRGRYTGEKMYGVITFLLDLGQFGMDSTLVGMTVQAISRSEAYRDGIEEKEG